MKKLIALVLLGASWMVFGISSRAQTVVPQESSSLGTVISKQDLDLLRKDLRAKTKRVNRRKRGGFRSRQPGGAIPESCPAGAL